MIGMCHSILLMVKDVGGIACDRMYVIFIFTWELSWDMTWEVGIGITLKEKMAGPVIGMCHSILLMVEDVGGIACDRMYVIFVFTWELNWDMKW